VRKAGGAGPQQGFIAGGAGAGPAASQRVTTAEEALKAITVLARGGELPFDQVYVWERRLADARYESAIDHEGMVGAVSTYRDHMKQWVERHNQEVAAGRAGSLGVLEAKYRLAEAEEWLARVQAEPHFGPMGSGIATPGPMGGAGTGMAGMMAIAGGGPAGGAQGAGPAGGVMGGPRGGISGGTGMGMGGGFGVPMRGGMGGGVAGHRGRRMLSLEDAREDPQNKEILKQLDRPIPMEFANETTLRDVIAYIKQATKSGGNDGIPIYVDPKALADLGVGSPPPLDLPITMDLKGIPLKTTLRLLLNQVGLAYAVKEGLVIISNPDSLELSKTPPGIDPAIQ
jgi:hypothetical protein